MKQCIYRFVDSDNNIIYIGKSKCLKNRMKNHRHLPAECYENISRIEYAEFDTLSDVAFAEKYLIGKIKPLYNKEFKDVDIDFFIDEFEKVDWIEYRVEKNRNAIVVNNNSESYSLALKELNRSKLEIKKLNDKILAIEKLFISNREAINCNHIIEEYLNADKERKILASKCLDIDSFLNE